jgi:hypothetical protein
MYESLKSDSKLGELDDQAVALISSKSKWTFADALIRAPPVALTLAPRVLQSMSRRPITLRLAQFAAVGLDRQTDRPCNERNFRRLSATPGRSL